MKRKILEIADKLRENQISADEAQTLLLGLFDVSERSIQLAEEITRLQQKYDENGYDLPSLIKLQRMEQHIDMAFKIWADGSLNAR
jgi:hypothetical protein